MAYAMKQGPEMVSASFTPLAGLAGMVIAATIGGAVWEDKR